MNFFSGIGGSMDVRIPLGQDGKCRGFAFVEFDYPRSSEEVKLFVFSLVLLLY